MTWKQFVQGKSRWMISLGLVALLIVGGLGSVSAVQGQKTPTPRAPVQAPIDPAIRILVDEAYLNTMVVDALEDEATLSRPVVDLRAPDLAVVTVTVQIGGTLTVRPTAEIELAVVDHRVVTEVRDFNVNGMFVPRVLVARQLDGLKQRMEQQINQELVGSLDNSGLELVGVSATADTLVIDLDEEKP